jgi:hypothetical protein
LHLAQKEIAATIEKHKENAVLNDLRENKI